MPIDLKTRYQTLIADGRIEADPAQRQIAFALNTLAERLQTHRLSRKSSHLGWFFAKKTTPDEPLRGIYIHGSVGRGKTMLMDMFFRCVSVERKRRAHFHSFMQDVHARIHTVRNSPANGKGRDPIEIVAEQLFDEAWLLCFDEFSVTDIADAMILGRLFSALWKKGAVVVATSNVEPVNLYKDGLNRALFLPFIDQLMRQMDVLRLDARTDYRLEKLGDEQLYFTPNGEAARAALDRLWDRMANGAPPLPRDLAVLSRSLTIPVAGWGVARFTFQQLCGAPLAANDYLAIARAFHTVIIDDVPVMGEANRNEAKRFITAIDIFYEAHVKLVLSAAAEAGSLYQAASGTEAFEFQRTVSRLIEMRSTEYLGKPHGSPDSVASGKVTGIVET